jgi:hypothetical protein
VDYDEIGIELGGQPETSPEALETACKNLGEYLTEWPSPTADLGTPMPLESMLNEGASPVPMSSGQGFGCMRSDMISDALSLLRSSDNEHAAALASILEKAGDDLFWFS